MDIEKIIHGELLQKVGIVSFVSDTSCTDNQGRRHGGWHFSARRGALPLWGMGHHPQHHPQGEVRTDTLPPTPHTSCVWGGITPGTSRGWKAALQKRTRAPGAHQADHEPATHPRSKGHQPPGLHWGEDCQQVWEGDPAPPLVPACWSSAGLPSTGETWAHCSASRPTKMIKGLEHLLYK